MNTPDLPPCPAPGAGVHGWIMAASNRCRNRGLPAFEAVRLIEAAVTRPPKPRNEIETTVAKAYSSTALAVQWSSGRRGPVPITKVQFHPGKLAQAAARIRPPRSWRHWLWERSPKRPDAMNALSFLAHLYRPGELILAFDNMEVKLPRWKFRIACPMDCTTPKDIEAGARGLGVWFLSNPVDGEFHHNPRQDTMSCRSEEAVTSFRYAVLESDQADPKQWLALLVQLPMRVSAIYTSGGRSVHSLLCVDAGSKKEWDEAMGPLKRPLKVLGADPGALSAVRLTRLPGCWRTEKNGFQKLLYLHPDPPEAPLWELPILFPRAEALARWRRNCPRWNKGLEAFA
jgi:hypothetical protein